MKYELFSGLDWLLTQQGPSFSLAITMSCFDDPNNYLVLVLKCFIWISKFKTGTLSIVGFKNHLKSVLRDLKVLYNLQNKHNNFDVFNDLFNIL